MLPLTLNGGYIQDFNWNKNTTTVQDVLDFRYGIGLSASYDASGGTLRLEGNGQPFQRYQATAHGGPGFFAANGIHAATTGVPYAGSVASSGAATAPPGIDRRQGIGSYSLAEVTETGGQGFLDINNLGPSSGRSEYTASISSAAPVNRRGSSR